MSNEYNPVMLGMIYVNIRSKHFAQYSSNFNPDHFVDLGKFLEKEQINPNAYFDYAMGFLELKRPLSPAKLADPELLLKFKATIKEENT